ncbi:MAG: hypothetical protein KJO55_00860 [Gammaproteobacteria bacterium]|nr:hypothetical protein [Gammaproteobacteria bacterium]
MNKMKSQFAIATLLFAFLLPLAKADTLVIDIFDVNSYDLYGDPSNEVYLIDMAGLLGLPSGTPLHVTGVAWDVSIASQGASWLSEAAVEIADTDVLGGITLTPANDTASPGTMQFSSTMVDLVAGGLDFMLGDGVLRLEFFELYDDAADSVDAVWNGSIEIEATAAVVPLPATAWLLLSAVIPLLRSRRRKQ